VQRSREAGDALLPPTSAARADSAGLRRSANLLRAFRVEQTDPARFYGLLARDSVRMVGEQGSLAGRTVLDVGAGPVQFAAAFAAAGARYVALDADPAELRTRPAIAARGERLPLADRSVDVCFSSNVVEHVPAPWRFADELVRVTRSGGLVVLAYTNWLSPWGGHETSPWHLFGGEYAARRYERRNGRPPKNRFGESMFALGASPVLKLVRSRDDVTVLEARPRYYPRWCGFLMRLPVLRDLLGWNLLIILRRDS
jgi:SAM-dependent methyltransferase